jgi:hypothetical protein
MPVEALALHLKPFYLLALPTKASMLFLDSL